MKRIVCFSVFFSLLTTISSGVFGQFEKDAFWVPRTANTLMMVDVRALLDSPLGKSEKWRTQLHSSYKKGLATFPTSTSKILVASEVDFEFMEPLWQVAVLTRAYPGVDLKKVTKKLKGFGDVNNVSGYETITLRNDAYLVKIDDSTLASMEPANRQMTARWLRDNGKKNQVSPYLETAIGFAETSAQVMIAFDLRDALDPQRIATRIKNSALTFDSVESVSKTIASVQGIQFAISVTDKINGAIKVDFVGNPQNVVPHAKAIIIAALEKNGLMVSDLKSFKVEAKGNQIFLRGELSNTGLNQVTSFIEHPISHGISKSASGKEDKAQVDVGQNSKMYLSAVVDYSKEMYNREGSTIESRAKWFEKYARQIDGLSVLNVDPAVVDFSNYVSASFRDMTSKLRESDVRRFQNQTQYGENYEANSRSGNSNGYYNGYNNYNGYEYRHSKYTGERVKASKQINNMAIKEMKTEIDQNRLDLEKQLTDLRREMTTKYKIQF
ncbi:hypothetical protein OAF56_01290 [Pirellulaceae bacterium]|nr:hypothetical protein [Pirellulaceae bacterium]